MNFMSNVPIPRDRWNGLLVAAMLAFGISCPCWCQEDGAGRVELARTALERLVKTKQLISKERQEWRLGKEVLVDRTDLVKREIESLRKKITDIEQQILELDGKKKELAAKEEALEKAASSLGERILPLERRTQALLKRLPPPLVERVAPISQRIPANPEETKLSMSDRFLNVVYILKSANKFNREITTTSEVRKLADGSSKSVQTMYIGVGQAYFASNSLDVAGVGSGASSVWTWEEKDQAVAAEINRAIAILKSEEAADFIRLPIEIK